MCTNDKQQAIYDSIIELFKNLPFITKKDMENPTKNTGKPGIYFLYDKNDKIIYVGKVGEYKNTSLYHRMSGHGNGAHKNKNTWYNNEVEKCKYLVLKNMGSNAEDINENISIIERICIKNNPNKNNYNDKALDEQKLVKIIDFLKKGK